jgi:hypothetical protein
MIAHESTALYRTDLERHAFALERPLPALRPALGRLLAAAALLLGGLIH